MFDLDSPKKFRIELTLPLTDTGDVGSQTNSVETIRRSKHIDRFRCRNGGVVERGLKGKKQK
jgi:hypothetical protein